MWFRWMVDGFFDGSFMGLKNRLKWSWWSPGCFINQDREPSGLWEEKLGQIHNKRMNMHEYAWIEWCSHFKNHSGFPVPCYPGIAGGFWKGLFYPNYKPRKSSMDLKKRCHIVSLYDLNILGRSIRATLGVSARAGPGYDAKWQAASSWKCRNWGGTWDLPQPSCHSCHSCRQRGKRWEEASQISKIYFASPKPDNSNLAKFTSPRNTSILPAINRHDDFWFNCPSYKFQNVASSPGFPSSHGAPCLGSSSPKREPRPLEPSWVLGRAGSIQRSTWNRYGIDMNFLVV